MKLNFPIGEYSSIGKLFQHLMLLSKERPFNLIIDEFQELDRINPSVFGEIQKVWDLHKDSSRMNLLISGSIYSLMHKILRIIKSHFSAVRENYTFTTIQGLCHKANIGRFSPRLHSR